MTRNEKRLLVATARAVRDLAVSIDIGTTAMAELAAALSPFDEVDAIRAKIRHTLVMKHGRGWRSKL